MSRRYHYFDDPAAPQANSLVPSVNVAVTNHASELLLIRRTDNGNWALPGGAIDLGESVTQAAVRETREVSQRPGKRRRTPGKLVCHGDPRARRKSCDIRRRLPGSRRRRCHFTGSSAKN
ncbi:NUDIX domain-containing protein [Actinomadura madurae]